MPSQGAKRKVWLIPAAQGVDMTSDPAHLAPGRAQQLVNLMNDRPGILRNQVELVAASPYVGYTITGLGIWYDSTNPYNDRVLIVNNGTLRSWYFDLQNPITNPPVIPPMIIKPHPVPPYYTNWTPGVANRMFQVNQEEIILADDGQGSARYTGNSNTVYPLGMNAPNVNSFSFTTGTPTGGKTYSGSGTNYCLYQVTAILADGTVVGFANSSLAPIVKASWTSTGQQINVKMDAYLQTGPGYYDYDPVDNPVVTWQVWVTQSYTSTAPTTFYLLYQIPASSPSIYLESGITYYAWSIPFFSEYLSDTEIAALPGPTQPSVNTYTEEADTFVGTSSAPLGKTYLANPTYFQYVFTLVDEFGRESNVGYSYLIPSVGSVTTTDLQINISAVIQAASPAYNVQSVNVYVSTSSTTTSNEQSEFTGPWYLVGNVPVSGTTPWTITISDAYPDTTVTGGLAAPHLGQNDAPNQATLGTVWMNHVILDDLTNVGGIQIGNTSSTTQFATIPVVATDGGRITVGEESGNPIMGLMPYGEALAIFRRRGLYYMLGSDITNFDIRGPVAGTGCISKGSVIRCESIVFYLSDDGVYTIQWSNGFVPQKVSKEIEASLFAQTRANLESSLAWFYQNAYYLSVGTTIYRYDLMYQSWTLIAPPSGVTAVTGISVQNTPNWIFVGQSDVTLSEYWVSSLCTYYPNSDSVTCLYQTAQQGDRAYQRTLKQVRLFGTGTVTAGTTTITIDGVVQVEAVDVTQCFVNTPGVSGYLPGCLFSFEPPVDAFGFVFDVQFALTGVNIQITDCVMAYEEDEQVEG